MVLRAKPRSLAAPASTTHALFASLELSQSYTAGFLAAIATGPDHLHPSEWLPALLDAGPLHARSDAARGATTLTRMLEDVRLELEAGPDAVCPGPDDVLSVTEFCRGYLRGARMHRTWLLGGAGESLRLFATLAGEVPGAIDRKHRARIRPAVAALFELWRDERSAPPPFVSRSQRRNSPCACGSGKKTKKCCDPS